MVLGARKESPRGCGWIVMRRKASDSVGKHIKWLRGGEENRKGRRNKGERGT